MHRRTGWLLFCVAVLAAIVAGVVCGATLAEGWSPVRAWIVTTLMAV